ncbi:MAG: transmembrane anchor protein, partial [Sphingopyxis terrae]
MYNSNIPSKSELPSTGKLITSTVIAMATAGVLLVTVVLPSEY